MGKRDQSSALRELQSIPGVGERIAQDLFDLKIRRIADLKQKNPEELYARLCFLRGRHIDRCMLYVLRSAVYFASHTKHNPEKLKWPKQRLRDPEQYRCALSKGGIGRTEGFKGRCIACEDPFSSIRSPPYL